MLKNGTSNKRIPGVAPPITRQSKGVPHATTKTATRPTLQSNQK